MHVRLEWDFHVFIKKSMDFKISVSGINMGRDGLRDGTD